MEIIEPNSYEDNLLIKLSMDMFNRKYKIRDMEHPPSTPIKQVHPKDIRFYNKRLLHLFKSLLIKNQSPKNVDETKDYITNLPSEIVEMGDEFITQCILFFKREDTNELIQQELIQAIEEIPVINTCVNQGEDTNYLTLEDISNYDKELYQSSLPKNTGIFEFETEDQEECKMMPTKREFRLRDNRLRLKGISKNNNMAILYEQDEATV